MIHKREINLTHKDKDECKSRRASGNKCGCKSAKEEERPIKWLEIPKDAYKKLSKEVKSFIMAWNKGHCRNKGPKSGKSHCAPVTADQETDTPAKEQVKDIEEHEAPAPPTAEPKDTLAKAKDTPSDEEDEDGKQEISARCGVWFKDLDAPIPKKPSKNPMPEPKCRPSAQKSKKGKTKSNDAKASKIIARVAVPRPGGLIPFASLVHMSLS